LLSPNGINTILFDFDGTLRHSFPLPSDFFTDFVLSHGYSISHDDRLRGARWEHYYWASSLDLQKPSGVGTLIAA
jgi:beta-phosphoglucomutase-like phosphatase (HAD superfamily)